MDLLIEALTDDLMDILLRDVTDFEKLRMILEEEGLLFHLTRNEYYRYRAIMKRLKEKSKCSIQEISSRIANLILNDPKNKEEIRKEKKALFKAHRSHEYFSRKIALCNEALKTGYTNKKINLGERSLTKPIKYYSGISCSDKIFIVDNYAFERIRSGQSKVDKNKHAICQRKWSFTITW